MSDHSGIRSGPDAQLIYERVYACVPNFRQLNECSYTLNISGLNSISKVKQFHLLVWRECLICKPIAELMVALPFALAQTDVDLLQQRRF